MTKRSSSIDQVRESLRLQQIYNTISSYGLDMALDRGALGVFRRRMQGFIYQPGQEVEPLSIPVKVRLMLQELGPTYVKMGQIISSRAEVLPAEWMHELNKLQSNVPPFSSEEVREIITEELGDAPERLYQAFIPTPFAAASTAQVHRAELADGTKVVVKVQRPGIRKQMKADIGVMGSLSNVLERRSQYARDIDLPGMIREFGDGIIRELDYGGELYNMKRLARNMEGVPGVSVPKAYPQLSSSKVLTMEFMAGVKINNVEAIDAAGLDRLEIGQNILRALIKQLLIDGFFHADPHPGNVLVNLETGAVGFLDMGMMGEIDLNQRLNLINLLMVSRQKDAAGLARAVRSLSVPFRKSVNDGAFYKDFERAIGRYMDPDSPASFGPLMGIVFDLLATHGLRLDSDLTLAIKAMMQAEAIYTALYPEGGGLVEMGFDTVKELALQETTADNVKQILTRQASMLAQDLIKELPSLKEATLGWLGMYRRGRFEMHVDTSNIAKEVSAIRSIAQQVILGIVLVGMLVGSAIAASFSTVAGDVGSTLAQWALTIFFVSVVITGIFIAILVYRLLWPKRDDD
ncbi:MAG: AarF/ABC1/UbiB kinase family protein [Rhizobiales bacterium]|jgi:ubiquinone biosynthesis protein|nr:AarF/ABC1/UbiB kinase family protein [Hyphomicrobiales bacterium]